uniref:Uncharacterized protein n=1 Tax=Lepeophtheirus salmonis TaxID=72036 RepID=A0A0K2SX84_LEPSM
MSSDEAKIELFGINSTHHLKQMLTPKNTISTVKYGGRSIMFWGYFSAKWKL